MSTLNPNDWRLLVSPVYLAGSGDPATIQLPFDDVRGWGKTVTEAGLLFTSPRMDTQVAHLPNSRYGGWKITRFKEPLGTPTWSASFSRNTPAEITAAFAHALAECLTASEHTDPWDFGPHNRFAVPAGVLSARGWRTSTTGHGQLHHSPDGHAYFCRRTFDVDDHAELADGYQALWTMYAGVEQVNGERWHAEFTNQTPLYLVTEAVRALSSPTPVERARSAIPERNLPYVTASPASEQARDLYRSAALARTPQTPATAAAPPAGTSPTLSTVRPSYRRR